MKKIAIFSPFNIFPPYWGGASRIYNMVKYLASNNEIHLISNDYSLMQNEENLKKYNNLFFESPNVKLHSIKSFTKLSQIINPLIILKGFEVIKKEKIDLIVAEFVWSGLHAMILHVLTGIPYVLDEHNVEFIRFERIGRGDKLANFLLKTYEKISCKYAYKILCVSDIDKSSLISLLGVDENKILVVTNGVDTDKFYPNKLKNKAIREKIGVGECTPLILFNGKLSYKPNREAVKIIYSILAPKILDLLPEAKFLIVGDNPPSDIIYENIIFTGVVDDIENYINTSNLVICPLLSGGGTRIKIIEALACGKVVISTSIGAEGLIGEKTSNCIIIADEWNEFVSEIIKNITLNHKEGFCEKIIENYCWKNLITDLEAQI